MLLLSILNLAGLVYRLHPFLTLLSIFILIVLFVRKHSVPDLLYTFHVSDAVIILFYCIAWLCTETSTWVREFGRFLSGSVARILEIIKRIR